jgi:hypothetical protein
MNWFQSTKNLRKEIILIEEQLSALQQQVITLKAFLMPNDAIDYRVYRNKKAVFSRTAFASVTM